MEDILTGEQFTLFSPGITDILSKQPVSLWFNLIGFNGDCWQSFGPIAAYKGFEIVDIFFFATELDRRIESEEDIARSIDKNPVPYMMLLAGSNYPRTVHKQDPLVQAYAEYTVDKMDTVSLKKTFTSEYSHGVYRFTLKRWGEHPHFAQVYYDEKKQSVLLTAATDRGFLALVKAINKLGYGFPEEPDVRVNISMLITAEKILRKKLKANKYEQLFHIDTPPENKEFLDKMNAFMGMILPDMNAGRTPDIEKMAARAGLDVETARDFYNSVADKFGQMDRQRG